MATDPNAALVQRQQAYSNAFPLAPTTTALKSQIDSANIQVAVNAGAIAALDLRVVALEEAV